MSDAIPHAVLSEQLEECINGRRLVAAVFLTFEFDPGFFEQEILPVLLDVPVSHARGIRMVQLEDALRGCAGRVAVYYDVNRLVSGDAGSARLDVARIPMRFSPGVFHPKNILLLLEEKEPDADGHRARSLLIGALSANLTRSGWWENIEVCHFEEIAADEATRLKEDLEHLLRDIRRDAPGGIAHDALDELRAFLKNTGQRSKRVSGDRLLPHFYSGREAVPEFLDRVAGNRIRGGYLEIISPYLDDASSSAPLKALVDTFQPKEVRVLLPVSRAGEVACRKDLYETVRQMPNVQWGRLSGPLLKRGGSAEADERFIHAKIYRFFTQRPKQEICFVGSVNLTRAAHQNNGNWETGILVEVDCPSAPEFWMEPEGPRSRVFAHKDETDSEQSRGTPLMLRYHWDRQLAEAYWDAKDNSPALTLKGRGIELGVLASLNPGTWVQLGSQWTDRLAAHLKESSFVEVHGHTAQHGLLLIQEEGMSHKPSLLLNLSAAEILRYWALLTPAQRSAFLEARIPESLAGTEGAELLARFRIDTTGETFFDRFAGCFHSFSCLEREVRECLKVGRNMEANYRLFGRKYDSLSTLLQVTVSDSAVNDDVNRYVIFLCARQMCSEMARDFPDYWRSRSNDVRALVGELDRQVEIRARLAAKDPGMPAFLDWFDQWFLKRADPVKSDDD